MPFPRRLTAEEHARDKAKAEKLIANGLAKTWRDLGDAFGLTSAGAAHRFGKVYGLRLPSQDEYEAKTKPNGAVSVELDAMTMALIDQLRGPTPRSRWLRNFLVAQLPGAVTGADKAKAAAAAAAAAVPVVDLEPVTAQLANVSAGVEMLADDLGWVVEALKKALGEEA